MATVALACQAAPRRCQFAQGQNKLRTVVGCLLQRCNRHSVYDLSTTSTRTVSIQFSSSNEQEQKKLAIFLLKFVS